MINSALPNAASDSASSPPFFPRLEVETFPGHGIRRLQQVAVAVFSQATEAWGVTPLQFAVLQKLVHLPGIDQRTLARNIGFDTSTIGSVIDRLEARGLMARNASPADRSVRLLSLTEAGNKFDGLVTLKAGKTNLYASENLNVLLNQTGDTTLGTDKALTLGGTAANLVTDSAVLTFGATRVTGNGSFTVRGAVSQLAGQALQVDGATTVDATGQTVSLTEAANTFGGLVTVKAGQTDLRARDSLNVSLDQTGAIAAPSTAHVAGLR